MKIYSVVNVRVERLATNPVKLSISAFGWASTPGWTNIRLDSAGDRDPNDDVLELDFAGDPPTGIVPQVLSPVGAHLIYEGDDAERIAVVLVRARSNSITVHSAEFGQTPPAGAAMPPAFEGLATTLRIGEEGPFTTLALGEESPPRGPFPPTTLAIGEEGPITDPRVDDPLPPTAELGEGGPWPMPLPDPWPWPPRPRPWPWPWPWPGPDPRRPGPGTGGGGWEGPRTGPFGGF